MLLDGRALGEAEQSMAGWQLGLCAPGLLGTLWGGDGVSALGVLKGSGEQGPEQGPRAVMAWWRSV